MENPFSGVSRHRKERKVIDPGIYVGTLLDVKSVQVTDKKTQEKKTKVILSYYIPSEDAEIPAFFNPSINEASFIVKFLKASMGSAFTAEAQSSGDAIWAFIQSLVGKDYHLVVTQSDGWNNVQSAIPIKGKLPPAPAPAPALAPQEDLTFSFNDDSIPF